MGWEVAAAAGITALAGASQTAYQGKMNRKTRNWANQQTERARDWALQDYHMQNEYNSPKAQMARLKEAGLNPHLVYGNGAQAQGASMPSPPEANMPNQQTPDIQGAAASTMAAYQNTKSWALQNNLLKTQNTLAERDVQLKEIMAQAAAIGVLDKQFEYELKSELRPYNISMKKKQLETLDQNIMESLTRMSNTTWQGNREAIRLDSDMKTADLQRMIMRVSANKSKAEQRQIEENIENLKKTGKFQDMQNELFEKMKRLNMTPNDPAMYKLFAAFADKLGQKLND